ncbi:unnamed protein product, partial [Polarella glacialis]
AVTSVPASPPAWSTEESFAPLTGFADFSQPWQGRVFDASGAHDALHREELSDPGWDAFK